MIQTLHLATRYELRLEEQHRRHRAARCALLFLLCAIAASILGFRLGVLLAGS